MGSRVQCTHALVTASANPVPPWLQVVYWDALKAAQEGELASQTEVFGGDKGPQRLKDFRSAVCQAVHVSWAVPGQPTSLNSSSSVRTIENSGCCCLCIKSTWGAALPMAAGHTCLPKQPLLCQCELLVAAACPCCGSPGTAAFHQSPDSRKLQAAGCGAQHPGGQPVLQPHHHAAAVPAAVPDV